MQLINILQVALLAASQASAAPVAEPGALSPNAANVLTKRADPAPVTCGRKLKSSLEMEDIEAQH